jgi:hypothetical protein
MSGNGKIEHIATNNFGARKEHEKHNDKDRSQVQPVLYMAQESLYFQKKREPLPGRGLVVNHPNVLFHTVFPLPVISHHMPIANTRHI